MTTPPRTPEEIRRAGLEALAQALGPVGMVRFLQQYEAGMGDYTADRERWLAGLTVADITAAIDAGRRRDSTT